MSKKCENAINQTIFNNALISECKTTGDLLGNYGVNALNMTLIALNRIKWRNLPDTMNARQLELDLLTRGGAVAYRDTVTGKIYNAQFTENNTTPDIYNDPKKVIINFPNGSTPIYKNDNFVVCWNNSLRIPTIVFIESFSKRIQDIETTIQMNLYTSRVQTLFKTNKNAQLSLENTLNQFNAGRPFMVVADNFDDEIKTDTLNVNVPFICDKLYELKKQYINEFKEFIGCSIGIDKKERLITDEILSSNESVRLSAQTFLESRVEFAEKFNKMFNKNIEPYINDSEVIDNVDIYNNNRNNGT